MGTITLPNFRVSGTDRARVRLKDGGVYVEWSTMTDIKAWLYSVEQKAISGRFDVSVSQEDPTVLVCDYSAQKPQYLGPNRIIVQAKYNGRTKTYDKPLWNFVRWTADQDGEEVTMEDPEVDVEIVAEDMSSSVLDEATAAALSAADRAEAAAEEAEHMVEIHRGPAGKSPYKGENGNWFEWDEEAGQYVDTGVRAKGETGDTPDISIGTVTTVEPGEPAAASMSGTPEAPVLNLSIPKGLVGAMPNFTVGTVTTGAPGTPVVVTLTGTAEAPVLNITIPQGAQGNTGSSVDYPFELVNNLTTDDATKGLSAAQGVVLDGKISQLDLKVDGIDVDYTPSFYFTSVGKKVDNILSALTPFIPVSQGDVVVLHNGYSDGTIAGFAIVYDSSKAMLSEQYYSMYGNGYYPERTVTLGQASAAYIRMPFAVGSGAFIKVNNSTIWKENTQTIGVEEYHLEKLGAEKKIFASGEYIDWQAGYIRKDSGTVDNSSANSRTGYIDISGFKTIRTVMSVTTVDSTAGLCFYTAGLSFISSAQSRIAEARDYEERIIEVPTNAKFLRTSIYNEYTGNWYLYGETAPEFMEKSELTQYIGTKHKVTMEFGNLDAIGQIKPYASDFFSFARTSLYYKMKSVNLPYSYKIYVYGSDYALVDTITATADTDYQLDATKWHKITINYSDNSIPVKEIVIDLDVIEKSYNIITAKTIKTFQYLVKYKKGRGLYGDGDSAYSEAYNMADDLISNTLRLYLPSNYSPTGEPVKMIYKAHGSNGYSWIDLDTWGGDTSIDYLADEGFALYDMFAGTSYYSAIINPNLTHDSATRIANYNVPIQLAAQVAAYEWVVRNFNVDARVYVFGKSHGGMAGIYATNKIVPTRAVALFAPLITPIGDLYNPWGNHLNECSMCLDDMCFDVPDGMTFDQMVSAVNGKASGWKTIVLDNAAKQAGLIAYINGVTNLKQSSLLSALMDDTYKVQGGMDDLIRHSETPVKVWCAPDDAEVVFANGWNFVKSLQNGGSNAQFREFPSGTGGHYFDNFTNASSIKDTVTTALGVQYTAPRAYIELVNYFNQF